MDDVRWGMMPIPPVAILGENTCLKITAIQSFIVVIILVIIQPKFIKQSQHDTDTPRADILKVLIITALITTATYFIPTLVRRY